MLYFFNRYLILLSSIKSEIDHSMLPTLTEEYKFSIIKSIYSDLLLHIFKKKLSRGKLYLNKTFKFVRSFIIGVSHLFCHFLERRNFTSTVTNCNYGII